MRFLSVVSFVACVTIYSAIQPAYAAKSLAENYNQLFEVISKAGAIIFSNAKSEDEVFALAKHAVSYSLKDPESAQFRNLFIAGKDDTKAVCGEVNAKNSYGGYVGFKKFITSGAAEMTNIEESDDESGMYIDMWCSENKK